MSKSKASAYVDGSFNPNTASIGSAVILIINQNSRPHKFAFQRQYKALKRFGANIAEINACKTAVKAARSLGVTDLTIFYDWNGLEFFSHKSNIKLRHQDCQCFSQYADYIERMRMNMHIRFVKVKAHSSNELNARADKMARAGVVV
jgi:ribonuclease HI